MSKIKTISEQIDELEQKVKSLSELDKIFDLALKNQLGYSKKQIQKIIKNQNFMSDFELHICNYFNLKNEAEKSLFLTIMCAENSKNYFISNIQKNIENESEQDN